MRIGDIIYFAPEIRFRDVDLNGPKLPDQFRDRMAGFYIKPAEECAQRGYAFAAGVLLVSCVDALARIRYGNGVGKRFGKFADEELQSFSGNGLAERFYDEFRNGLVHEGRLKKGSQFSLETGETVERHGEILLINPKHLAQELRSALDSYVALLARDDTERKRLTATLREDFAADFGLAGA